MRLDARVRDCLFLNWALPVSALRPVPEPLRYETHGASGEAFALISAVCLRQQGSRLGAAPAVRLAFPQFNIRSYVLDDDGVPSVFFHQIVVPPWAWPAVRWIARTPVRPGFLQAPPTGSPGPWEWRVGGRHGFACRAEPGPPCVSNSILARWEDLVASVRGRNRGYFESGRGLRRITTTQPDAKAVPVAVELLRTGQVRRCLAVDELPPLHSAFLCPELPLVLEVETPPSAQLAPSAAAPG